MYTKILNVQIIVSLLKQHGIKHLVLSAGTRHVPLAHSVENDDFFKCYSVVDERSAAYFAIGLSKELNEPVAIACTSSTATCNYVPGIAEAYFQHIPLLVLTGDRDPHRLGQLEDQMIDQVDMYRNFCKKCVNLPVVKSDDDIWYCQRLVNEAILELTRHGSGPVQINFPINQTIEEIADASAPELPAYNRIERIDLQSESAKWEELSSELKEASKILVVTGSGRRPDDKTVRALETFTKRYNAVIATEYLSNIDCEGAVNTYMIAEAISATVLREIKPDIVIFFGGNFVSRLKILLRNIKDTCVSWNINDDGIVVDPFQNLNKVIECSPFSFFDRMAELNPDGENNRVLYDELMAIDNAVKDEKIPEFTQWQESLTAFSAMKLLSERIPEHSLLHLSILNSTRIMQMFPLAKDVDVYSNIGTDGIDGSMSTFFGQSFVTDRHCFLVIGDLSFFYDMNSIGIRHINKNVRILLINNSGGAEFYFSMGPQWLPNIDMHISAAHHKKAKDWVLSNGFRYISASDIDEYRKGLEEFMSDDEEGPVVFEIFTDKLKDVNMLKDFRKHIHYETSGRAAAYSVARKVENIPGMKAIADSRLGKSMKDKIKKVIR